MPPLTHAAALEILKPHLVRLSTTIRGGWDKYVEVREGYPFLEKTARANFVHDAMVFICREQFEGIAGTRIVPYEQSWMLVLEDALYIRLKKLSNDCRPDNFKTPLQQDILGQQRLAGFGPSPTYLVAGYTLNDLETAIRDVWVVCPLEKVNKWTIRIDDDGSVAEVVEIRSLFDEEPTPVTITPKLLPFRKADEIEADQTDDDETDPQS